MSVPTTNSQIAVIMNEIKNINMILVEIKDQLQDRYITNDQFYPVKLTVYGIWGILGAAVLVALITLVIR